MGICPATEQPCNCVSPKRYGTTCWTIYRREKGYISQPYHSTKATHRKYETSDKGRLRRQRYAKKVRVINKITGINSLSSAFSNPESIQKLRQAFIDGNPNLLKIWTSLNEDHRNLIAQ